MNPNILIICCSHHHSNTYKIAQVLSEEMKATLIQPKEFDLSMLSAYELIAFGSGIYNGKHHKSLLKLVSSMPLETNMKTFVFSTSSVGFKSLHKSLNQLLEEKGFNILDEYSCKGFMNYGFTKYLFGGLNKKRPNADDFEEARQFAKSIMEGMS